VAVSSEVFEKLNEIMETSQAHLEIPWYARGETISYLLAPDDTKIEAQGGQAYPYEGRFYSRMSYDLPDEVLYPAYRLVIPSSLAEALGAGPGDWIIPFDLMQVDMIRPQADAETDAAAPSETSSSDSVIQQATLDAGAVYQPTLAPVELESINVALTDVAVTDQETAVRLLVKSANAQLGTISFNEELIHLADDLGNQYSQLMRSTHLDDPEQRTLFFEPLKPGASRIILTIDGVDAITSTGTGCDSQPRDPNCLPKPLVYRINAETLLQPGMTLPVGLSQEIPNFPGESLTLEQVEITGDLVLADWSYTLPPSMKLLGVCANLSVEPPGVIDGCGGVSHSGVQVGDALQDSYYWSDISPGRELYLAVCAWEAEVSGPWILEWELPH
jgi:hypothetical protein